MNRKNLTLLVAIVIVLTAVTGTLAYLLLQPSKTSYRYASAQSAPIQETVRATGQIKPAQNVDMSFELSGRIAKVNYKVGDQVKVGDILMELDNSLQAATVDQARAMLLQKQAGATQPQIDIYKAAADAAKADISKTITDTAESVNIAQAALDTAENNLKLASGGDSSQIVSQAYESAETAMQATLPKLDDALTQADSMIGVDNSASVINFQNQLSALDPSKLAISKTKYTTVKQEILNNRNTISALNLESSHTDIDSALLNELTVLSDTSDLLSSVSDVLNTTLTGSNLTSATLSGMKTVIQTTRTGIVAQSSALVAYKQATSNAKNSLDTVNIAYNKATEDLTNAKSSAASAIKLKQLVYAQAQANLQNISQPTRSVDLAPLRAALESASAAYAKTQLHSPLAGIISHEDGKAGAIVIPNIPVVSVMDQHGYQLEIYVSGPDVAKIKIGDKANATLDAYGSDTIFPASVIKIDPATSQAGYKVTLQFANDDVRLKPDMAASATIITQDKPTAVIIPGLSVIQRNGEYFVLVKNNSSQPQERQVQVGIKDTTNWEITSGLQAGEQVVNFGK